MNFALIEKILYMIPHKCKYRDACAGYNQKGFICTREFDKRSCGAFRAFEEGLNV
jgi:hypothetical protein